MIKRTLWLKEMINNSRKKIAIWHLKKGGVIAHQTDTVVGLACLPSDEKAIKKIIKLKRRREDKGLILLGSNITQFKPYLSKKLPLKIIQKLQQITKEPTTWLVPVNKKTSTLIRGKFDTIAMRITNDPEIVFLCQRLNSAIISTSANIKNKPPAKNTLKLRLFFKNSLDFILLDKIKNTQNSLIKNIITKEKIR
jgi:L-threonylcarbamoyladenylate synthase